MYGIEDRCWAGSVTCSPLADEFFVVMLPPTIEYPLFSNALSLFEELQPDPAHIADDLERAGLTAHLTYESFPQCHGGCPENAIFWVGEITEWLG